MLIVSGKNDSLDFVLNRKNESSKQSVTETIAEFLAKLTDIKNNLPSDLKVEKSALNKAIMNLIRSWSDSMTIVYSGCVKHFIEKLGYAYPLNSKSNSANFKSWLEDKLQDKSDKNIREAIWAQAQACTYVAGYTSPEEFSKIYERLGAKVTFIESNKGPKFSVTVSIDRDLTEEAKAKIVDELCKKPQNPFYYEHYIPVYQIKKEIEELVLKDDSKTNKATLKQAIYEKLNNMIICWITGRENSRIPKSKTSDRGTQLMRTYMDAGISIYQKDGDTFKQLKSNKDIENYVATNTEKNN